MRNSTDLDAEVDRSRGGVRPISSRKWTDLAAECDRFRRGTRPISVRSATDLGGEAPPPAMAPIRGLRTLP